MTFTQLFQALDKRGLSEAVLKSGEPMRLRVEGQWREQGSPAPLGTLAQMIEDALPPQQRQGWETSGRCQFVQEGYAVKAAREGERVQIAVKRQLASQSPFAGGAATADSTTIIAPTSAPVVASAPASTVASAPASAAPLGAPRPLVPMPGAQWYYLDGDEQKGPFATDRFKTLISMGTLDASTVVWRDGLSDWMALGSTELAPALPVAAPAPAPIAAPTGSASPVPRSYGYGQIVELPRNLDSFNWGAFLLPVLWCAFNGQSSRGTTIFFVRWIPIVGGIISLFLGAQLAAEANQLAWAERGWTTPQEFEKVQKRWLIAGVLVNILPLAVFFYLGVLSGANN